MLKNGIKKVSTATVRHDHKLNDTNVQSHNKKISTDSIANAETFEKHLTVTLYKAGFDRKPNKEEIGTIQNYFKSINRYADRPILTGKTRFIEMLKEGVPHIVACYGGSNTRLNDWFVSNIMVFDHDGEKEREYTKEEVKTIEKNLKTICHILQKSSSWTETKPKYHCYVFLDVAIHDHDRYQLLYEHYRLQAQEQTGLELDASIHPYKPIFAGKKIGIYENENKPYLKTDVKITVKSIAKRIYKKNKNTIYEIDFDRLKAAVEKLGVIHDSDTYFHFLSGLQNGIEDGLLSNDQAFEIARIVWDGQDNLEKRFDQWSKYNYSFGTVLWTISKAGIDTRGIMSRRSKKQQPTKIIEFEEEFLSMNEEARKEFMRVCTEPGKRLVIAPTGSGKNVLLLEIMSKIDKKYSGLKVLATPRIKLMENLLKEFEKDGRSFGTYGSDMSEGKYHLIGMHNKFLTTMDYTKRIVYNKMQEVSDGENNLIVFDEAHMLLNDSNFKAWEVIKYRENAENIILNMLGSIVHMTATPQHMKYDRYNEVIEFRRTKEKRPFKKAEKRFLGKDSDDKLCESIFQAAQKNVKKKFLVFIENKKMIDDIKRTLNKMEIKTISLTGDNKTYDNDQDQVISDRKIPSDVRVILATTTLAAGVSIENNKSCDEIWIHCSSQSLNTDDVTIIQMANRFRKLYQKLVLLLPKKQGTNKQFMFHEKLEEELERGNESLKMVQLRANLNTSIGYQLNDLERNAGIYQHNGNIKLSYEKIASDVIYKKKLYNLANPMALISELQEYYDVIFDDEDREIEVSQEIQEGMGDKTVTELDQEEYIEKLLTDQTIFDSIYRFGNDSLYFKEAEAKLPKKLLEHLLFLTNVPFNRAFRFNEFVSIMKTVHNNKSGYNINFIDDFTAFNQLKELDQGNELWKEVVIHLKSSNKIMNREFKNKKELLKTVTELTEDILQNDKTRFKPKDSLKFFNIEYMRTKKSRSLKINGLMTEKTIGDKYQI